MASRDGGCAFLGCLIVIPNLLFWYWVLVLIFRYTFGIELPNPLNYLTPDWQQHIPRSSP